MLLWVVPWAPSCFRPGTHTIIWNIRAFRSTSSKLVSTFLRHAVAGVVFSWVWSFVWNTAPLFGWGSFDLEGVRTTCAPNWYRRDVGNMSYIIIYLLFCFAVPFFVIIASYSQLLWTLHQVNTRLWIASPHPYFSPNKALSCFPGDQAAGGWGWQHKSCGGAGGPYGGAHGAGLPSHLVAIRQHGPRCCHGFHFIHRSPHRHHSRVLG